jgi:hypothetical protein
MFWNRKLHQGRLPGVGSEPISEKGVVPETVHCLSLLCPRSPHIKSRAVSILWLCTWKASMFWPPPWRSETTCSESEPHLLGFCSQHTQCHLRLSVYLYSSPSESSEKLSLINFGKWLALYGDKYFCKCRNNVMWKCFTNSKEIHSPTKNPSLRVNQVPLERRQWPLLPRPGPVLLRVLRASPLRGQVRQGLGVSLSQWELYLEGSAWQRCGKRRRARPHPVSRSQAWSQVRRKGQTSAPPSRRTRCVPGTGVCWQSQVRSATHPQQVHFPPPTSDLITRQRPEVGEVTSTRLPLPTGSCPKRCGNPTQFRRCWTVKNYGVVILVSKTKFQAPGGELGRATWAAFPRNWFQKPLSIWTAPAPGPRRH